MELTLNLSACRHNCNLTLRESAERIGVAYQTLCDWENHKRRVMPKYYKRISKAYNVPIEMIRWEK